MSMPVKGTKTTTNEDGVDKEVFTIAFTNGALEEIEGLKKSLEAPDLESVVRLGIALLSRIEKRRNVSKSTESK